MKSYQKLLEGVYDDSEKSLKATERQLALVYKSAYQEVSQALADIYRKMGDPPSLQEARRYNRLLTVKQEVAKAYKQVSKKAIATTGESGGRAFTDLAYGTQWAIDQATGIALDWENIPVDTIRASIMNDEAGETYQERFKNWSIKDQAAMNTQISIGLARGESYPKVAKRIKDTIQASYEQAIRIVRTENTRNWTQGHNATYDQAEELGIGMVKKWEATLDERTRSSHGQLDGVAADKDGLFWIGGDSAEGPGMFGVPEHDINCRCRVYEEIVGLEPEFRRIHDEGVVDYVDYDTWARAKGWTPEDGWPKEAKI